MAKILMSLGSMAPLPWIHRRSYNQSLKWKIRNEGSVRQLWAPPPTGGGGPPERFDEI